MLCVLLSPMRGYALPWPRSQALGRCVGGLGLIPSAQSTVLEGTPKGRMMNSSTSRGLANSRLFLWPRIALCRHGNLLKCRSVAVPRPLLVGQVGLPSRHKTRGLCCPLLLGLGCRGGRPNCVTERRLSCQWQVHRHTPRPLPCCSSADAKFLSVPMPISKGFVADCCRPWLVEEVAIDAGRHQGHSGLVISGSK